jgi:hypothetical protein
VNQSLRKETDTKMKVENADHQMIALGEDQMALLDNATGDTIATATRANALWTVVIQMDKGKTFSKVKDRESAINHMIHDRPDVDPDQPGFITMVPHSLLGPNAMP